eukprot:NODE_18060_length_912_cov_5.528662.p1 GENE.NODE_18060_length_912_cov_5.528662~~NODE_18060_length_912_cov_5.528662.p1  ORF type:complete len:232 (+),score=73.72 NODE_18060_length_912_cov_5.528662:131-826(+)
MQAAYLFRILAQLERPRTVPASAASSVPFAQAELYLNVLFYPSEEYLHETRREVKQQLGAVPTVSGFFHGLAEKLITNVASSDRSVASAKLAEKFTKILPDRLAELGIVASVEEAYRKGSFVIARVSIRHSEFRQGGRDNGGCFRGIARFFGTGAERRLYGRSDAIANATLSEVMCDRLPKALPEMLVEKGLEVEIDARCEADEVEHFLPALRAVSGDARRKGTSPAVLSK